MTYRWLTPEEIVRDVNPALASRGWSELNTEVARVLGAFDGDTPVEVFALQLFPFLGPLLRVDNTYRDNGEVSRVLAQEMEDFLAANEARGCLAIADSPVTERLCQRFGMRRLDSPVFIIDSIR